MLLGDGKRLTDQEAVSSMMKGESVKDVQQYLNKKRAILERKRIQKRDNMFNDKHPHRF